MTLKEWQKPFEDVFKKGYGEVEADLLIKDGKKLPILSNGVPLTIGCETYFTGIGIDITEQRKAKQELLET